MNIENTIQLKEFIASHHKPELAKQPGMVWQVWEDGELTLQKSGPLLWQRNLHMIKSGICNAFTAEEIMPQMMENSTHGYAFIESEEVGVEIRKAMLELAKKLV